jgi:hypothetical protein
MAHEKPLTLKGGPFFLKKISKYLLMDSRNGENGE